jgi:2-dehydro-3-deoxygluconokinase
MSNTSDEAVSTPLDMVTVGEAMALFIAGQTGPLEHVSSFCRAAAGAELNVAVGMSRLGFSVGYVSRVGKDSFGRGLLDFLASHGIDQGCVAIDPTHPTGFMLKSLQLDGADPQTEYFRRGSAASHLARDAAVEAYCGRARLLHLSGISPALSASSRELVFALAAQARTQGRTVSFDPNLRPALWPSQEQMVQTLNDLAARADLVLPGLAEGRLLTGCQSAQDIARFYRDRGARQVVVKLGPDGAYFSGPDEQGLVPARWVAEVVDTVGAGDGFAVGVISALLEGLDLRQACHRANAIGARVVQFPGDSDGLPDRTQLAQAMRAPLRETPGAVVGETDV